MSVEAGTHNGRIGVGQASWFALAAAAVLVIVGSWIVFYDGLSQMVKMWGREEYNYAYLVPLISAWLIWQKRGELAEIGVQGAWTGVLVIAGGLLLAFFGELSTIYTIIHYAFIVTIAGVALAWFGWRGLVVLAAPLFYLVFMVPLPEFLYQQVSGRMMLISSELGVAMLRLFGISVFLEGNVIDLGVYKLQVVEACNGLRYLFPLLSFGFLCAYLYKGPLWHKLLLMASTVPITIVINSFRIAVTGVLVENFGVEMADGFMHFFEGWVIFLAAVALFFGQMVVLARLSGRRAGLSELLRLELVLPQRGVSRNAGWLRPSRPLIAGVALLTVTAVAVAGLPERKEYIPDRRDFAAFPMQVGSWRGQELILEKKYVDALRIDDHILANFHNSDDPMHVNFYVAYYGSQRKGASAHSPRSCIPGGGWEITSLTNRVIDGAGPNGEPIRVQRAVISLGLAQQVVYYWFDQRGRHLTNEYHVKLMIFWDAMTRNRTDGALVRLVTPVAPGQTVESADTRLEDFMRSVYTKVEGFIPS
ncbi:MAG: VPLPA-CTERM-specific exosortase XrtD [Rhodospirillales bacterium]|nr:MAG: VPLPA-CTERM-specific exosortase XrtD [Rhodospirillales bacterium]